MGRKLFLRAAGKLVCEGMGSMMLWVLADNPTRGFYEALGGIEAGKKEVPVEGKLLTEAAYRWKELKKFLLSAWLF